MSWMQSANSINPNDWRNWSSADWNSALVNAVFRDPENVGRPIKRVTATARFLAQIVNEDESEADLVKTSFLRSFGSSPYQIRRFYRWTPQKQKSLDTDCPNFFAQLYLTLLAGSADEKTYRQGDFRKRFSLLMSHAHVPDSFPFDDLARMWLYLAKWAQKRVLDGDSCRPLNLPNPRKDIRIGYSKRLAYPSYIDERRLGLLITNLDDTTDWKLVTQLISKNLSTFSSSFREEFDIFNDSIVNAHFDEAFNSPFWAAIQDLTWDIELIAVKKNGSYILTVDMSDPNNPWIDLWGNDLAIKKLDDECEASHLPTDSLGYKGIIHRDGIRWSARDLRGLVNRHAGLSSTALGKGIKNRELAFLPDEFGRLSTSGKYTGDCRVVLLLDRVRAQNIAVICDRLCINAVVSEKAYESDSDAVLFFPILNESDLLALTENTNDALLRSLFSRRSSTPMSLSGGSWFGQLLLMNPASSPVFRLNGAVSGEYEFFSSDTKQLCHGALEPYGEGGFRINSRVLSNLANPSSVKVELATPTAKKEKILFGRSILKEGPPQKISNLNRWKVESQSLCLSELENDCLLPADINSSQLNVIRELSPLVSGLRFDISGSEARKLIEVDFTYIHQTVRWLWDALALRFQYAQTISFRELYEMTESACQPYQLSPQYVIRALSSAGWIVRISISSFRADSYACGANELIVSKEGDCRLIGPVSTSYWNQIKLHLAQLGKAPSVYLEHNQPYCIGVVALKFDRTADAQDFADKFNLPIRSSEQIQKPFLPPDCLDIRIFDQSALVNTYGARFEKYVRQAGWVDVDNHQRLSIGDMLRPTDKKHRIYLICYQDRYVATDSDFVARLLSLSLTNQKIGIVNNNSDITFNNFVMHVPRLLSRWCMALGAGCVTVGRDGSISFLGLSSRVNPSWLHFWTGEFQPTSSLDVALSRRDFALSIRRSRRILAHNSLTDDL